ncbi:MAG: hypothetical protein AAGB02_03200 [Pseudomonadota bacterium]
MTDKTIRDVVLDVIDHATETLEARFNAIEDRQISLRAAVDRNRARLTTAENAIDDLEGAIVSPPPEPEPEPAPDPVPENRPWQLGFCPWLTSFGNREEPFVNLLHAGEMQWSVDNLSSQAMYDRGHVDPVTMLPGGPEGRAWIKYGTFFTGDKRPWYGQWVLETDGDVDAEIWLLGSSMQVSAGPNRTEFTIDERDNDHDGVLIRRMGPGGLKRLAIYRKENETAYRNGEIWSPRYVEMVRRHDVFRDMNLTGAMESHIYSVDDIASVESAFWGNRLTRGGVRHPRRSIPREALINLAVKADVALWHNAPIELGASFMGDHSGTTEERKSLAAAYAAEVYQSPEWRRYAVDFVAALDAQDYPDHKPLYVTLGNEVDWNYVPPFIWNVEYLDGLGRTWFGGDHDGSRANGRLLAHFALILNEELKAAGRGDQPVTYVIESHTANTGRTTAELSAVKAEIESQSVNWNDMRHQFGVALTHYWSGSENRPDGQSREDFLINGPDTVVATIPWILKKWAAHRDAAAIFGVKIIGAYEGGSHANEAARVAPDWHWGEGGALVNTTLNEALISAYPGLILMNYAGAGGRSEPWFDGDYGEANPMQQSWAKFERK